MIKTISFVTNLEGIEKFEEYFCNEVCPRILKTPGIIGIKVTSLLQMSVKVSQYVKDVQLMIETYYESMEALNETISSTEGQKLFELVSNIPTGEVSIFVGKEKMFTPSNETGELSPGNGNL